MFAILAEAAADIEHALKDADADLRETVARHLPAIKAAAADTEAVARSSLAKAALTAVHLSPELGDAFASAIAIAEADVARFAEGTEVPSSA